MVPCLNTGILFEIKFHCRTGLSGNHCGDQAAPEILRDLPTSVFEVLGLKTSSTVPSSEFDFFFFPLILGILYFLHRHKLESGEVWFVLF